VINYHDHVSSPTRQKPPENLARKGSLCVMPSRNRFHIQQSAPARILIQ
jgi:hypothetical protein